MKTTFIICLFGLTFFSVQSNDIPLRSKLADIFNTISSNIERLYKKGVFGTPTIVVGNRMYLNVQTENELTQIIEKEIKNTR